MATSTDDRWNATLYDDKHAFVHRMASGVLELLAPENGERILDLGCGTGALTRKIADAGADVVGIDASPAMIDKAKHSFPGIAFEVGDARSMRFDRPFDAIFSNAALHWVKPPERAVSRMWEALRPGGRLVLEMGGKGNVEQILTAALRAGTEMGVDLGPVIDVNYFPSIAEYTGLMDSQGFEVTSAILFDRPTPLSDGTQGLRKWIEMFRPGVLTSVLPGRLEPLFDAVENQLRPRLYCEDTWYADYRRLRITATRPASDVTEPTAPAAQNGGGAIH